MNGTLTIIKADGTITTEALSAAPGLDKLQKSVGGLIEFVGSFDTYKGERAIVLCNEEGKLHKLPFNTKATAAWDEATDGGQDDILVGDVAIVTGDDELLEAM